jgi:hypothetical protein
VKVRGGALAGAYLATLAALTGWWLLLEVAARSGPIPVLAAAYVAPATVWALIRVRSRQAGEVQR